ncbi:hypothetical protein V8B97DRAFT_1918367 [Scleroderma yunnanense]
MTTNTIISMPATNTLTEIVADATNSIKGQLESIKTNKSEDHWEKEWYGILNEMAYINMYKNHVQGIVDKLPCGMSIPTLLLVMVIHLPTPEECSGWPDWQMIIQCGPEDVAGHPWVQIGSPRPGEQAEAGVSSRQDKGPSQGHGHSQLCDCSQSHHLCKIIKSTDHVNSNDEVVNASAEGELQAKACLCPFNIAQHTWGKQAKSKPQARKQSIPPSPPPPTAASSWWLSNHGTSKSPGPLIEPLKTRLQPLSHKRKGCSSSAGPSHTKVPHEIFDGVVVVTPAWLVKGHPWNASPNPSKAVTTGTMPTCSRCTNCSSKVDDLESEVTGLRWDLEAPNQQHEVHDHKVDALRDLVKHLQVTLPVHCLICPEGLAHCSPHHQSHVSTPSYQQT